MYQVIDVALNGREGLIIHQWVLLGLQMQVPLVGIRSYGDGGLHICFHLWLIRWFCAVLCVRLNCL
jgi:hypothetical protein